MRITTLAFAAATTLILGAVSAQAMPTPIVIAPAAAPPVTRVGFICGYGFHLDRFGVCVRDAIFVRPLVRVVPVAPVVYARACVSRWTAFGFRRVCR